MRKSSGIVIAPWTGLLLLLVFDARAQENLPACVSTCMEDIAVGIGCVSSENLPCTCRTPSFVDNVLQCFSASCTSQADQQRGSDEVRGQCIAYTSAVVTESETSGAPSETGSSSASATGTPSTITFTSMTTISEPPPATTTIVTVTSSGSGTGPSGTSSAPSGTTPLTTPTVPPSSSSQSVVATVTSTRVTPQPSGSSTSGSTKVDVNWQVGYLWTVLVGIGLGALFV